MCHNNYVCSRQVHFEILLVCRCSIIQEMWSEAIKILKGEYTVRAIKEHKMDQAIIFCRTKIDCDNLEQYFMQQGGGNVVSLGVNCVYFLT